MDEYFRDGVIITHVPEGAERLMLPVLYRDRDGKVRKKVEEITLHAGDMIYGLTVKARTALYVRGMAVPVKIRKLKPEHQKNTPVKRHTRRTGLQKPRPKQRDLLNFLSGDTP